MKFQHKGYALSQAACNNHYMIFAENGRMVMRVPYNNPLTEEKAREFIDGYIFLREHWIKLQMIYWKMMGKQMHGIFERFNRF